MITYATEHYISKRLAGMSRERSFTLTKLAVYDQLVTRLFYSGESLGKKDKNDLEYIIENYNFTQSAELRYQKIARKKSPAAGAGASV